MGETWTQAQKRFAEKDRIFSEREKSGQWPTLKCDACEYVACTQCGESPLPRNAERCRKCTGITEVRRVCCMRHHHHVGDCCTHCGQDERKY